MSRLSIRSGILAKVKIALRTSSAKSLSVSSSPASTSSRVAAAEEFRIAPTRSTGPSAKAGAGRASIWSRIVRPIRADQAGAHGFGQRHRIGDPAGLGAGQPAEQIGRLRHFQLGQHHRRDLDRLGFEQRQQLLGRQGADRSQGSPNAVVAQLAAEPVGGDRADRAAERAQRSGDAAREADRPMPSSSAANSAVTAASVA